MVQTVVVNHPEATSLNSSDLGSQNDNFGQNSISVTNSGNKSYRYDPETNQVSRGGVSSYESEVTRFVNAQGNYSQTFDPEGSVELPGGIVTSAKVALRSGLIDAQGNPAVSNAPQQQGQEQQPEAASAHESFAMGEQENQIVNDALPENLSGSQVQVISNQAIEATVTGDFSRVVNSLVQGAGLDPAQATERVNQAFEAYSKASHRYLSDVVGIKDEGDREDFFSWAQTNAKQDLKDAVQSIVGRNQFKPLGKMVRTWMDHTPPSTEALKEAGYKVGKASDGTDTVFISGFGEVSVKNSGKYF